MRGKGTGLMLDSTKPIDKEDQLALHREAQNTLLTMSDVQILEDEMKEIESEMLIVRTEPGSSRAQSIDMNAKGARLAKIKSILETRTPIEARGKSKDALIREEKELEDSISKGMPTHYEMNHPARCPGAVRKFLKWDEKNKANIRRYVEIQKMLRPEEPKSIEALRQEK